MTTASVDLESDYFEEVRDAGIAADICRVTLEAPKKDLHIEVRNESISVKIEGPEPHWLRLLLNRFVKLLKLPHNWDSFGGLPIEPMAIAATIQFMASAIEDATPLPQIVPSPEGRVRIEWHQSGIDLEIEIGSRGPSSFFYSTQTSEEAGSLGADLSMVTSWIRDLKTA